MCTKGRRERDDRPMKSIARMSNAVLGRILSHAAAGYLSIRDQERAIPVFRKALAITVAVMEARKASKREKLEGESDDGESR